MTLVHLGNQRYEGVVDDMPLASSVPAGAEFTEEGTHRRWIRSASGIWEQVAMPEIGPERWYVYRTGTGTTGPYYALNKRTGEVVYTGSSLDAVLDQVLIAVELGDAGTVTTFLSSGGHIFVDGNDQYYRFSTGFDGFTIPPYTIIEGPPNCRLLIPNGYTGYVFRIPSWHQINPTKYGSSTNAVFIRGFNMDEGGTPAKNWTGILLEGWAEDIPTNPGGIAGCGISGTKINDCKTGVLLDQVSNRGWITTCWFEKVYVAGPKWAGFDQQLIPGSINEFANNVFRDCAVQSSNGIPAYGFRNMGHKRVIYDNCCVWDVINGQIKGNFDPQISEDNVIIGGILADSTTPPAGSFSASHALVVAGYYAAGAAYPAKYVDGQENTCIVGDFVAGNQFSKIWIPAAGGLGGTAVLNIEGRKIDTNTQIEVQAADDAISTILSLYNKSKSERFMFTRSSASIDFDSVKQTAGGSLRPMRFRMNDVPGAVAVEAFRILTTGNIQVGDGRDFALGTVTGTKIGNATTQKLGFFNKTPIVQPAAITAPTAGTTIDTEARTAINSIRAALTALGLTA